jgi:protease-4
MRRAIGRFFAWIGGLVVIATLLSGAVMLYGMRHKRAVPARTLLELNLETALSEDAADDPVAKLTGGAKPDLHEILFALERAESDPRVTGLVARLGAAPMGVAQVQELRDAVQRFRQKGKFALAFAETFGEFSRGNSSYYLATAFDEVWLQPSGDVGLTGVDMESWFVRGTLDKLGVKPRMDQRYEYKNAMNMLTETKFTPAHREALAKVGEGVYSQMLRGIAEGRKLPVEQVKALVDKGPFLAQEALNEKLVDQLAYRDAFYAKAKERAGAGVELLYLQKYLERADRPHKKGKHIALIYGVGAVTRGPSESDPLMGSRSMGADTVTAAFRAAVADKDVRAILFRVDSPGGSYVASDSIWREVNNARSAGKPVIVSMGNVAGSGGYFVAMAADKIVAEPGTITGSIGVLGGKLVPTGLLDKVGLSVDEVHFGQNATMYSRTQDYTPAEWARFEAALDRIYDDFTSKVAQGRKLDKARVLQIAKGRIWIGEDAKQLGLIDELGGLHTALALAKKAANIPEGEDVTLQHFPPKKTALRELLDKLGNKEPDNSEKVDRAAVQLGTRSLMVTRELLQLAGRLEDGAQVLQMPELGVEF